VPQVARITAVEQLNSIEAQRRWSRSCHAGGRKLAFVPTMGALHAGHLSLVAKAKEDGAAVVVSIFVNPTQFDNPDDLARYPVTLEQDLAVLAAAGVDAVFLPSAQEMYPNGFATFVEVVGPLTDKLCAVARPGHFRGVATVVAKLFSIVQPDIAVFGEKDLQQVLIISRMVGDLNLPVEIRVGATLRDPDGLPMSSRNRRLSPEARAKALSLPRGLELANRAFKQGEVKSLRLTEVVYNELLVHAGVEVDYCDVVSVRGFEEKEHADDSCVLACAAFVDGVRLIDHVLLGSAPIAVALEG
jgi:pantoate--beta-alanine ligase